MNINEIRNKTQYLFAKKALKKIYDFPYAIIKGLPLSMMCYNTFNERVSTDIDILLPKSELSYIEDILKSNNFIQNYKSVAEQRKDRILCLSSSHQIIPYYKNIENHIIIVDINFDIFWGEYTGKRIDINSFLSDTIDMYIYGEKIKTLTPTKMLIQLILHHYKDLNSIFLLATRKSIKIDMFKDIYYLLKNNLDSIILDKLYAISAEYEIIPYVYYLFYYTGLLFEDDILKRYIAAFKTPEGEALLNCYGLNEAERCEWKFDFQTRIESKNLYDLIKDDLTEKDFKKIEINRKVFLSE